MGPQIFKILDRSKQKKSEMNKRHQGVIKRESRVMIIILRRQDSSMTRLGRRTKPQDEIKINYLKIIQKTVPESRRWIVKEPLNFPAAQSKEEERPTSLNNRHLEKAVTCHERFLKTIKMKLKSTSCEQNKQKKKAVVLLTKKEEELPK